MGTAARVALRAARWEACVFIVEVQGLDLDDADLTARVLLSPGAVETPLISVERTTAVHVPGVRLVSVTGDGWGKTSKVEVVFGQSQMEALPHPPERDASLELAWVLDVRMPGYLTPTRLYGPMTLTPDGGTSLGAGGPFSFGEQVIHVRLEAGQGPPGPASGPLGLGSVRAEHISNDAAEQDAIRAKIRANVGGLFDIRHHGAIGTSNGTTGNGNNNRPALVSAIAAASEKGGIVWLPPGNWRVPASAGNLVISASNVMFDGPGYLYFDFGADDIGVMGFLLFDGRGGRLTNVGHDRIGIFGNPDIWCTGLFDGGTFTVDPLRPGYDGSSCLDQFINCDIVRVNRLRLANSPNYGTSALNCHDVMVTNSRYTGATAAVQCQQGTGPLKYGFLDAEDTSDDAFACGYWGAGENTQVTMHALSGRRLGGRGVVALGATGHVDISACDIEQSFLAAYLIEPNAAVSGNRYLRSVTMRGNRDHLAGMLDVSARHARGAQVASAIRIQMPAQGGRVGSVIVAHHTSTDVRNSFLVSEGPGQVDRFDLSHSSFKGIAGYVEYGDDIEAGSGNGRSRAPDDGRYDAIRLNNVRGGSATKIRIDGAGQHALVVSASARDFQIDGVVARDIDKRRESTAASPAYAVLNEALQARADRVWLFASPRDLAISDPALDPVTSTLPVRIIHAASTPTGNVRFAAPARLYFTAFTGANATPTVGGLGAGFVGDAFGINGNQAYSGATAYSAVVRDVGANDQDVRAKITVVEGGKARVIARAHATTPRTGQAIFLEINGETIDDTPPTGYAPPTGLLAFFNASTDPIPLSFSVSFLMGEGPGTYAVRLLVKDVTIDGEVVTSYQGFVDKIAGPTAPYPDDPTIVASGTYDNPSGLYAVPVTNFAGIQEGNTPGTSRFKDFEVRTPE